MLAHKKEYEFKLVNINQLKPFPRNSRKHSEMQIQQVINSINEFGFTNPILVDEKNTIIAGHARLMAAKKLNMENVPCVILTGLTDTQKKAYVIADNKLALNAEWDIDILLSEVKSLQNDHFDIELTGFTLREIADITRDCVSVGLTDDDAVPEVAEETITKLGDIYTLGNHRLMCGDSTMIDDVEKLMNGHKADMVFTDPPYNIAEKTLGISSNVTRNKQNKKLMESEWDKNFKFDNVAPCIFITLKKDSVVYICASHFTASDIWRWMDLLFDFYSYCIWSKPNPFPSLMKKHWAFSSELICYATLGKPVFNYPDKGNALSVWDIVIIEGGLHPTQKPVKVSEHAILHSSNPKDLIIDLFGGSGSTLIACEKTNRKCFMMEISPHYCDVIVKRWEQFTGKKAVLNA